MLSFQERVYKVVSKIPRGKVMTYSQVAKAAGSCRAFRAVGNALNKNPHPLIIPCHRVVRSDGKIGGWRGGPKKKAILLKREGLAIKNGRVLC